MSILKPSGSLTEVDLIKQVALHYAKQDKNRNLDLKESAKENFRTIFRIYTAFTKLLKSQLDGKEKGIDTLYIGVLVKEKELNQITYLPSQDFLEAGKFKWTGDSLDQINQRIKEMKERGTVISLSHTAVGMMCNQLPELVSKVLNDLFGALIEYGRQTSNEVVLNLKIGNLHLFKNGEIAFEFSDEEKDPQKQRKRQEERDDLSVIDHASAILSQKGGKSFSIRSNLMENLSVKTPSTIVSSTYHSRVLSENRSQKNDIRKSKGRVVGWEQYKKRNYSKHNSTVIKDPIKQPFDMENSRESLNKTQTPGLPYPFLQAFIERQTGQRFGKKMKFDHPDTNKDMISYFIEQINKKKEDVVKKRQQQLEVDQLEIGDLKSRLRFEKEVHQQDKMRKRLEFLQANNQLLDEKQQKLRAENEYKSLERINYFPFTHGDQVENQREIIKEIQKEDLRRIYQEKLAEKTFYSKQRLLSTGKRSDGMSSPQYHVQDFFAATNSQAFMKGQKAFAYRQRETKHLEGAMNEALQRFENQLKNEEKEKFKQIQNFKDNIEKEKKENEKEEQIKSAKKAQVLKDLTEQIEQRKVIAKHQKVEDLRKYNTNYGPEESEEAGQFYHTKKANDVKNVKDFLEKQIQYKKDFEDLRKSQEYRTAQEQLAIVKKNHEEEIEEAKERERMRKNMYMEIWNEQCKLNEKTKQVENIFN